MSMPHSLSPFRCLPNCLTRNLLLSFPFSVRHFVSLREEREKEKARARGCFVSLDWCVRFGSVPKKNDVVTGQTKKEEEEEDRENDAFRILSLYLRNIPFDVIKVFSGVDWLNCAGMLGKQLCGWHATDWLCFCVCLSIRIFSLLTASSIFCLIEAASWNRRQTLGELGKGVNSFSLDLAYLFHSFAFFSSHFSIQKQTQLECVCCLGKTKTTTTALQEEVISCVKCNTQNFFRLSLHPKGKQRPNKLDQTNLKLFFALYRNESVRQSDRLRRGGQRSAWAAAAAAAVLLLANSALNEHSLCSLTHSDLFSIWDLLIGSTCSSLCCGGDGGELFWNEDDD